MLTMGLEEAGLGFILLGTLVHDGCRVATELFGILASEVGHGRRTVLVYSWCLFIWERLLRSCWAVGS